MHVPSNNSEKRSSFPSYLGQRYIPKNSGGLKLKSKEKSHKEKFYIREIVCIPYQFANEENAISIPRGKNRAYLEEKGLIAKLYISNDWGPEKVRREVTNLFRTSFKPFEGDLQYLYLKTLTGSKILRKQKVSKDFPWDAKAVLNLARNIIYLLISPNHETAALQKENGVDVELDDSPKPNSTTIATRSYVELPKSKTPSTTPSYM